MKPLAFFPDANAGRAAQNVLANENIPTTLINTGSGLNMLVADRCMDAAQTLLKSNKNAVMERPMPGNARKYALLALFGLAVAGLLTLAATH